MELWDIYSRDHIKIGTDFIRGDKLKDGQYHLCAEVLVKHVDGTYLLMKRSYEKEQFGGYYEATAGGSALKGEDEFKCIIRELKEETGIDCKEFKEVAYHVFDHVHTIMHCYVCVVDCDKDSVLLQDGETIGYKWINRAEFIDFINSNEIVPTQKRRYLEFYKEEFEI